ncbi:hypothetical protein KCU62_g6858, partial [Aureobasidium sp. EXF-3399]
MAIASQRFPDWKFSAETWLLTCLFHNIDTVNKQTRGTLMSFEFYGGYLAMAQLQKLNSPATQAEIVAEALIRHQDTVETGNITTIGLLTQLTTQFNNMGCHADYIHLDTIKDVVKNYLRREWSVCFSTKIREEVSIKPWCQTTASTPRFPQVVQHSELMAPYDNSPANSFYPLFPALRTTADEMEFAAVNHQDRWLKEWKSGKGDSLQVLSLAKAITAARSRDSPPINASLIYEHLTVSKLGAAVANGVSIKEYSDFDSDDEEDIRAWEKMEETLEHYRRDVSSERSAESGGTHLPRHLRKAMKSHARPPLYQPDGGLAAWLQVVGSFLINMNNWGLANSFGVYQAYYQFELLQSHSASNIAWIGRLQELFFS